MVQLNLSFLGTFQVTLANRPITRFRSSNMQGLLAYLVMHVGEPVKRDFLSALIWPDELGEVARTNFRQVLYQLRKLLEGDKAETPPFFQATRQTVQFNPASNYVADVHAFTAALNEGDLETAVSLYQGDFLAGFTADSVELENWLMNQRESLHRLALEAMYRLTARYMRNGWLEDAQKIAQRQLMLEPWSERAHKQLIEILALGGNRTAALAQFEQCCEILADELGVSPSPDLFTLAQQIENDQLEPVDPNLIAGRYILADEIGRGAMGVVYQGRDRQTGQKVAIKMLNMDKVAGQHNLIKRFIQEGEILQQLNHPNIVKLLATDERDGKYYMVMEYIAGGDLRQLLNQDKPLPLDRVLTIGLDLADALTRAHRLNILHRDLKPANVLIDVNGLPRLTDFGIARLDQESGLTDHGAVLGTLAYISPEACLGEKLDERADLWSFGVLLFEMLTGIRPFEEKNLSAAIQAILYDSVPDIRQLRPDIPPSLVELINRLLIKNRDARIPSIRIVGATLEALLSSSSEHGLMEQWPRDRVVIPPDQDQTPLEAFQQLIGQTSIHFQPFQAPPVPPHFVGRIAELAQLKELFMTGEQEIIALVGMGGLGKSSLAAHVAQELQDQFEDGVLWGSVHTSETMSILELWGRAYNYDFSGLTDVESRATAVRMMLSDKQALIVLDNVDDAAVARPLLQYGPRCTVLITTRNFDVAATLNAHTIQLKQLEPETSLALLSKILDYKRVGAEQGAAAQICTLLHHLPLAVEITGQLLKTRTRMGLAAMAKRLENAQQRLSLAIGDQAVRASFEVSWEGLAPHLRETFMGMALFAGHPFTDAALAAVIDKDQFYTEDDLYTLTALSLVAESEDIYYKQHPLLALFAAEKLGDSAIHQTRFVNYYLRFAQENQMRFEVLKLEWENLSVAIKIAYQTETWQVVLDFIEALARSWLRYGRYAEAEQAYVWGQTAAEQLVSEEALASILLHSAEVHIEQSAYDVAFRKLEQGLGLYYKLEADEGVARTFYLQGMVLFEQGDHKQAEALLEKSQNIQIELGNIEEEANALRLLAAVYRNAAATREKAAVLAEKAIRLTDEGIHDETRIAIRKIQAQIAIDRNHLDQARAYALEALELSKRIQNPAEINGATRLLAMIYTNIADYETAERLSQACLTQARRLGNRRMEGIVLNELALIYIKTEQYEQARELTEQSLEIYRQIKDRAGYGYALFDLGKIYLHLTQRDQAITAWQEAQQLAASLKLADLSLLTQKYLEDMRE